ncbi:MAG: hypothetical protein F6K32_02780 [Desertifilum sp. SIO1I2]|nr:hypothetical protein [Desertifilum sp. SIO1I2]
MDYTNRPEGRLADRTVATVPTTSEYRDLVRWGPIIAGLLVAITSQMILSALGAAIGLSTIAGSDAPRTNAGDVGTAVGTWSIISLFIALFIGGWITTRTCGPMNRNTALLNGAILWATTLAVSAFLLASGVTGAFGVIGANAGEIINQAQQGGATIPGTTPGTQPNVTAQETRDYAGTAATVGWSFVIGSLLGLAASLIGASVGARRPHAYVHSSDRVD